MQPEVGARTMKYEAIARNLISCLGRKQLVIVNKNMQCYKIRDYLKQKHNLTCEAAFPQMPNDECKNIIASFCKGKLNIIITTHGVAFNMPLPEITQVLHAFVFFSFAFEFCCCFFVFFFSECV